MFFLQSFIVLSCLAALAMGESQVGLIDDFGGLGYGRAPIAPYGAGAFGVPPYGAGAFGPAPYGGGYGRAPLAFGPAPYGGAIGGFGRPYGGFGPAPIAGPIPAPIGGFGPAPYGAPIGGYGAPANYQFGYGVQTADYLGAASFGHNEERTPYGTVGQYHVNTPNSFQFVNYNVAGGLAPAYGAAPIPAYG